MPKGRHRAEREPIQWRRNYRWLKNRYYAFFKPAMRKKLAEIKLRFNR